MIFDRFSIVNCICSCRTFWIQGKLRAKKTVKMNISFDLKAITDMMSIAEAFLPFLKCNRKHWQRHFAHSWHCTGVLKQATLLENGNPVCHWEQGAQACGIRKRSVFVLADSPLLLEHSTAELRFAGIHAASKQSRSESDRKRTRQKTLELYTMFKNIDLLHLAALKGCLQVYCPNSSYGPVNLPISVHLVWLRYEDLKEPLVSLKFLALKQGREAFQHFFARDNPVPAGNIDSGLTWMEAGPASKWMYKRQVLDFPRLPCWSVR